METPIDLSKIPNLPGCYLYKDKNNIIIYVGKAKDLKKRVNSYFSSKFTPHLRPYVTEYTWALVMQYVNGVKGTPDNLKHLRGA